MASGETHQDLCIVCQATSLEVDIVAHKMPGSKSSCPRGSGCEDQGTAMFHGRNIESTKKRSRHLEARQAQIPKHPNLAIELNGLAWPARQNRERFLGLTTRYCLHNLSIHVSCACSRLEPLGWRPSLIIGWRLVAHLHASYEPHALAKPFSIILAHS